MTSFVGIGTLVLEKKPQFATSLVIKWFPFLRLADIGYFWRRNRNVGIIPYRRSGKRTYWKRTTGDQNSSFWLSAQKRLKVYMKKVYRCTTWHINYWYIGEWYGYQNQIWSWHTSGTCFGLLFIATILLAQLFGLSFSSEYKE